MELVRARAERPRPGLHTEGSNTALKEKWPKLPTKMGLHKDQKARGNKTHGNDLLPERGYKSEATQ